MIKTTLRIALTPAILIVRLLLGLTAFAGCGGRVCGARRQSAGQCGQFKKGAAVKRAAEGKSKTE